MRPESVLIHSVTDQPGPVLLRVWQPGDLRGAVAVEVGDVGRSAGYTCPNGWAILSPVFVPRFAAPQGRDGYVVCLAHAARGVPREPGTSGEEVWIFDAADVRRGPVCRLGHPDLDFAFTVHSAWVPALRPSPRDYHVSAAEDLDLEYLYHRSFGALSFWEAVSTAIETAMQREVVEKLFVDHVISQFAPGRPGG